jgi:hypothetical protein
MVSSALDATLDQNLTEQKQSGSIYIWIERHGIGSADATQFIEIKLHFIYLFIHLFIHLYDLGIHRGVVRTGSIFWCGTPPT